MQLTLEELESLDWLLWACIRKYKITTNEGFSARVWEVKINQEIAERKKRLVEE